jgi:predicted nucleotidyltransferase
MIPAIEERAAELEELCRRYRVRRLDLFGSAATGRYKPEESDLDFVVEFHPLQSGEYADTYFGLLEGLQQLFGLPVDLVVDSAIKNPYFRQSVEETRTLVYEAS